MQIVIDTDLEIGQSVWSRTSADKRGVVTGIYINEDLGYRYNVDWGPGLGNTHETVHTISDSKEFYVSPS